MTPSSVMGSHGRVPGGPLSRNQQARQNKTSYMQQRYGQSDGRIQKCEFGNIWQNTENSKEEGLSNEFAMQSAILPTTINSTMENSIESQKNLKTRGSNAFKPVHTYYSKVQRDRKKGVFQGELA